MEWLFGSGFKKSRLLPNVDASIYRLKIKITSEKANASKERRIIAELLASKKEELAKIRAEALFMSDNRTEALSILELLLEMIKNRIDIIVAENECPFDLERTISSIIYATDRIQIPELAEVRNQFKIKYGRQFIDNVEILAQERLKKTLSLTPPSAAVCIRYLEEIAISHNVDYTPSDPGSPQLSVPMAPIEVLNNRESFPSITQSVPVFPSPPSAIPPMLLPPPVYAVDANVHCSQSDSVGRVIAITHIINQSDQQSSSETVVVGGAIQHAEPVAEYPKVDPDEFALRFANLRK